MSNLVQGAYPVFTDIDGDPIEDGYIFIGEPALDPIANPIQPYWDELLTVPANNIRTKGGFPDNSGAPGRLFVAGTYSILVQNKRGIAVYPQTTFFETGAVLSLDNSTGQRIVHPEISGITNGNDQIRCVALFHEIPKQGLSLSLNLASSETNFLFGSATKLSLGSFTISDFGLFGRNKVKFFINQVGIVSAVTDQTAVVFSTLGTDCKLTIT